jgi:hypothetical protein
MENNIKLDFKGTDYKGEKWTEFAQATRFYEPQ